MYYLKNHELTVHIVDPVKDRELLGSRFCTGSYIYQISNKTGQDLLAGPNYPDTPDTFDGQGAPNMFLSVLEPENNLKGDVASAIGVGNVKRNEDKHPFDAYINREVIKWLDWNIEHTDQSIKMSTQHNFQNWSYKLICEVTLEGNRVSSKTYIKNLGQNELPVQWFPHPFFPIPDRSELFRSSLALGFPPSKAYKQSTNGTIHRKSNYAWQKGAFQPLDFKQTDGTRNQFHQNHPNCKRLTVEIDYSPSFLPIWGNDKCFSFEPYLKHKLQSNQSSSWEISYTFTI